jgi:guanylate kinase
MTGLKFVSSSKNDLMKTKVQPLVLCGPSGVGKGSIIEALLDRFPEKIELSVSHTTRKPREGEIDGLHYFFVKKEEMEKGIASNEFLEYAYVHSAIYGTSKKSVDTVRNKGKLCILDIDIQGVKSIKNMVPKYYAKFVFVAPPSLDHLEERLRKRATETEDELAIRLRNAKIEVDYGMESGNFDHILTNDNLEKSIDELVRQLDLWFPSLTN